MSTAATHDDANLILRLYELRREPKMREAREWFSSNFKGVKTLETVNQLCPPGSPENAYLRMVTSYWNMAASFVTSGVLNRELFFQSGGELVFVWLRVEEIVPQFRKLFGNPDVNRNLEEVAKAYMDWMETKAPGSVEQWRKMVNP